MDEGDDGAAWTAAAAAAAFDVHVNTVHGMRRRLAEGGLAAAVERPPRAWPPRARRLTPAGEQELLAVAQSAPPAGRARWTLHLLADRLVQLQVVDAISHETGAGAERSYRRALELNPGDTFTRGNYSFAARNARSS